MNDAPAPVAIAPIRKTIRVRATPDQAFATFVGAMGTWWLKSHSLLKVPQADVVIEPRAGGRWYEIGADGSEQTWGRVIEWDAPARVVLAWQLTAEWAFDPDFETVVEVNFSADGDVTLVDFEHRDLERFGANAAAVRGDYDSGMDGGWAALLETYRTTADAG